jgi:hypothetical protein
VPGERVGGSAGPAAGVILAGAGTVTVPGRPAAGVVPLPAPLAPRWPPAAPAGGHLQGRPFGCRAHRR